MYHRILRSQGGSLRMYEIENGKPARDAQFHVVPRAGDRVDLYDAEDKCLAEDIRHASAEILADEKGGGSQHPSATN